MTPEELDMMERIHFYGKLFQLNDDGVKLLVEILKGEGVKQ